jgi:predicted transcriptional regulator
MTRHCALGGGFVKRPILTFTAKCAMSCRMMTFSECAILSIRNYLTATGISTRELARRAGVREWLIRRLDFEHALEKGSRTMTLRTAHRIERAMREFPP